MIFRRDFGQLRHLIANISETQPNVVNRKTELQTTDTHAQANLIRCTLVYKQLKIGQTLPPAIVQRTGVNKSVAFARWQHADQARHCHSSTVCGKEVFPEVFCHFLGNRSKFLHEISPFITHSQSHKMLSNIVFMTKLLNFMGDHVVISDVQGMFAE